MTENDWLTHNLHERLTNLNTDLKVTIKSYDSEQLSFKDASDRIVQKIANLNKPKSAEHCRKISEANIADKLRGLFLYMWRAINKTVPKALEGRKSTSTYGGDLMRG